MQRRPPSFVVIIAVAVAIVLVAAMNQMLAPSVGGHDHEEEEQEQPAAAQKAKLTPPAPPAVPSTPKAKSGANKKVIAVVETDRGTIKMRLFTAEMPVTTQNFIDLANRKFFDGLKFHRVEDWVIQGGDPQGTGMGGSGKTIKLERNKVYRYDKAGMVGMARSQDPDSASSQWFIVKKPSDFLGDNYALFGEVFEGLDVVQKIQIGDKMKTVRIVSQEAQPDPAAPPKPGAK